MIDLGVATSVAKKYHYAWWHTIDYCLLQGLEAIQFYLLPSFSIQKIAAGNNIKRRYLHLPGNFSENLVNTIRASEQFMSFYDSNRLIAHQKETFSISDQIEIISKLTDKGYQVGIENEGKNNLKSYIKLLNKCKFAKKNIFAVLDIHRFFHDFYQIYPVEIILDEIVRILNWCKESELSILFHIIDSKSFSGDRKYWCPIFSGLVPYRSIFSYVQEKKISIDSIIFEFETENNTTKSIEKLRSEFLYFNKNEL